MGLSGLHPEVARRVERLLAAARSERIAYTLTSAFRTISEQQRLYDAWLARGKTGLPAARPGYSTHNYGFAVDIALADELVRGRLTHLAECLGLKWAGPKDRVHYDVFGPPAWRAALSGQPVVVSYVC